MRTGLKKRTWRRPRPRTLALIVAAGVIILVLAGLSGWGLIRNARTGIDGNEYQAVFLTNGQVYFGRLQDYTPSSMKLTDIFYLQAKDSSASGETPQQLANGTAAVQLIKLGNEVYGPQDAMIIPKAQVLYYENLKPDGTVAQTMRKYGSSH